MAQALAAVVLAVLCGAPAFLPAIAGENAGAPLKWFKGNLHTHTLASDGDTPPEDVARWYKEHGYDFLVITDHDKITNVSVPGLLLIPGEEVTDRLPKRPLHVNAIGLTRAVKPHGGTTVVEVMQRNIDAVREAGGVALINHPNFGWAFGAEELKKLTGASMLEIASGHPLVNTEGGGDVPSVEQMWDDVLTAGHVIYGAAVDDSHFFKCSDDRDAPRPGYAWVVVRAESATADSITGALKRGMFYSSTGVEIGAYEAKAPSINVTIVEKRGVKYRTDFVGPRGRILATSTTNPARYSMRGERYVRARVTDSNGRKAWMQPVFSK